MVFGALSDCSCNLKRENMDFSWIWMSAMVSLARPVVVDLTRSILFCELFAMS